MIVNLHQISTKMQKVNAIKY